MTEDEYQARRAEILATVGRSEYRYSAENAVLAFETDPAERVRARESRSRVMGNRHRIAATCPVNVRRARREWN